MLQCRLQGFTRLVYSGLPVVRVAGKGTLDLTESLSVQDQATRTYTCAADTFRNSSVLGFVMRCPFPCLSCSQASFLWPTQFYELVTCGTAPSARANVTRRDAESETLLCQRQEFCVFSHAEPAQE